MSDDERWAVASLCLARAVPLTPKALTPVIRWVEDACADLDLLPPLGALADLAALLAGANAAPAHDDAADPVLRRSVREYRTRVLERLEREPLLLQAQDALSAHGAHRAGAGARAVWGRWVERTGYAGRPVRAPVLRRVFRRGADALVDEGLRALRSADVAGALAGELGALTRALARIGTCFDAASITLLRHLDALDTDGRRLALARMADACERIAARLPRRIPARRRRGALPTRLTSVGHHPMGGYAGIGNRGGLESLVPSELATMEVDSNDIDAFDVRFATGELLRYLRDENRLARERRHLRIVLDGSLAATRVKDAKLPWQRLTAALGATAALMSRWTELLGASALSIGVEVDASLGDEGRLLALVCDHLVRRGVLDLDPPPMPGGIEPLVLRAERALPAWALGEERWAASADDDVETVARRTGAILASLV
ncbi:MAG TPA: hypothetical protein VIL20_08965 [Sandaracinaceae bacterium]